jgi:hypothetical protein
VSAPLRDSAVLATTCVTNALKSAKKPFVSRAVSGDHAPRHRGVAPQSGSSVSLVLVSSVSLVVVSSEALLLKGSFLGGKERV